MASIFRIHPAIGVARVGKSTTGYFLQGEAPGAPPFELDVAGRPAPFRGYKDASHRIRRQGVRFRVFEFDRAADGSERLVREVTPDVARIAWTVSVAAAKAGGPEMGTGIGEGLGGEDVILPVGGTRNTPPQGYTARDLVAAATAAVSGRNQPAAALNGTIVGRPVYLGDVLTDADGRLVILGGHGDSSSWENPAPTLDSYLNNPTWYDDIADGPVDARLYLLDAGGAETPGDAGVPVDDGAWFAAAPPDFAPDTVPVVTLFDIATDAWARKLNLPPPTSITFADDVAPILERAAGLAAINNLPEWQRVAGLLAAGGLDNPAGPAADRTRVVRQVRNGIRLLHGSLTPRQGHILDRYEQGQFTAGPDPARAPGAAELLDRAALDRCIGAGFYPGIELGFSTTLPSLWSAPGRLTRGPFTDHDNSQRRLEPGMLSQRMACPWQADFYDCEGTWWPAQRPDLVRFDDQGQPLAPAMNWHRKIGDLPGGKPARRAAMVSNFAALGVMEARDFGGGPVIAEIGRDPGL